MDELEYMKQLVREYLDLNNPEGLQEMSYPEYETAYLRMNEIEEELKELSGYED